MDVELDTITEHLGALVAEMKTTNERLAGIQQILADIAEAQESMAGLRGDDAPGPDDG